MLEDPENETAPVRPEYFGFKSKQTPPQIEEMMDFKKDMLNMVESIEFRQVSNPLQDELKNDIW